MALQHARTSKRPQHPIPIEVNLRNARLDIRECDRCIGVEKVAQQEPRPRIARAGIRHQKHIIGINRNSAPGKLPSRKHATRLGHRAKHPFEIPLWSRHFAFAPL